MQHSEEPRLAAWQFLRNICSFRDDGRPVFKEVADIGRVQFNLLGAIGASLHLQPSPEQAASE